MYDPAQSELLRTGDVVCLKLSDFKTFVKYKPILTLLEQFENDPQYPLHLWALLNQPCNMVHDETDGRYFQHNLFLCPLMGLKTAIKKGAFGNIIHIEQIKSPENEFIERYGTYLTEKAKRENRKKEQEGPKEYNIRLRAIIDPVIKRFTEELESVSGEFQFPEQVLANLKTFFSSNTELSSSINEFEGSEIWQKSIVRYRENRAEAEAKNSNLILTRDAGPKLAQLSINQMDSQGVFFFEPHPSVSKPTHDLAYVIFLQDMLTVKISQETQKDGSLVALLKEKRVLSLTENFSDRLLNIMGNFFSKIGTGDVKSDRVIELYTNVYDDSFFATESAFKERRITSSEEE